MPLCAYFLAQNEHAHVHHKVLAYGEVLVHIKVIQMISVVLSTLNDYERLMSFYLVSSNSKFLFSFLLQIIRNEDLEELRELGSGTFGTVYHGKWRGTDVAIKRIKKSCFAGRSSEQERLVSIITSCPYA